MSGVTLVTVLVDNVTIVVYVCESWLTGYPASGLPLPCGGRRPMPIQLLLAGGNNSTRERAGFLDGPKTLESAALQ